MPKLRNFLPTFYRPNKRRKQTLSRNAAEILEHRQLLSATTSFANGVLTVKLTANGRAGEHLVITSTAGRLQVGTNTDPNAFIAAAKGINPDSVREIYVTGSHRRDRIDVRGVNNEHFQNIQKVVLKGKGGNDVIHGSEFGDRIYGGRGNDTIFGLDGNDTIYGGADNDTILGGAGSDRLYGQGGNDRIGGSDTNRDDKDIDRLFGGSGFDSVLNPSRRDRHDNTFERIFKRS